MQAKQKAFIKTQLESGKNHDEVRRELISNGYGTAGYEEVYAELARELGLKEFKKPVAATWENTPGLGGSNGPVPLPSIVSVFKQGLLAVRGNLGAIIVATALTLVVTALLSVYPYGPTLYLSGLLYILSTIGVFFVTLVLSVVSATALAYTVIRGEEGITYLQGLQWSFARMFSLTWLVILVGLITTVGLVVLIIPGLLFLVYNCFSVIALMKDDQRGLNAIVRSTDLVHGAFLLVLTRLAVLVVTALLLSMLGVVITKMLAIVLVNVPYANVLISIPVVLIGMITIAFVVGGLISVYRARVREKSFYDSSKYQVIHWLYRVAVIIGVVAPILAIYFGYINLDSVVDKSEFQFDGSIDPFAEVNEAVGEVDAYILERKIDAMFNSGILHRNRLTSFEGVCKDVLIEAPVRCQNTNDTFVLDAPIGNGQYYCRDATGYKGIQDAPAPSDLACK